MCRLIVAFPGLGDLLFQGGLKFSSEEVSWYVACCFSNEFLFYANLEKTITEFQAGEVIKFILQANLMGLFGY